MTQKLADYLIGISNDPAQVEAYRAHPNKLLGKSGLDEEDKDLLRSGDMQAIHEKIERQEGVRSVTAIKIKLPRIS